MVVIIIIIIIFYSFKALVTASVQHAPPPHNHHHQRAFLKNLGGNLVFPSVGLWQNSVGVQRTSWYHPWQNPKFPQPKPGPKDWIARTDLQICLFFKLLCSANIFFCLGFLFYWTLHLFLLPHELLRALATHTSNQRMGLLQREVRMPPVSYQTEPRGDAMSEVPTHGNLKLIFNKLKECKQKTSSWKPAGN